MSHTVVKTLICASVLFAACTHELAPPSSSDDHSTYHQDVAPLLAEHCLGCHDDGRIAPFTIDSYEAAKAWGPAITAAVESRSMPPFGLDNSGDCNTYSSARWLSDEEIAVFRAWVDDGMLEGEPSEEMAMVKDNEPITLSGPILDPGAEYLPQRIAGQDDYRCFVLDPQLNTDSFLTGFRVEPGVPKMVHHLILYATYSEGADQAAALLDAEDSAPGYRCYGTAGAPAIPVAAWAPGVDVIMFPEGTGIYLAPGRKLIAQIHYWVDGNPMLAPDRTRVQLELAERVDRHAVVFGFGQLSPFELPHGQASANLNAEMPLSVLTALGVQQADVLGVFPHMHRYGRTLHASVRDQNGEERCLTDAPRYSFDWQQFHFFDEPFALRPEGTALVRCTYDTRSASEPVRSGIDTENEMCVVGLYMTVPGLDPVAYSQTLGAALDSGLFGTPPVRRPGERDPDRLMFAVMNNATVERFGANPAVIDLIRLVVPAGTPPGDAPTPTFVFDDATQTTRFPLRSRAYATLGLRDAARGFWFDDPMAPVTDLGTLSTRADGALEITAERLVFGLGFLQVPLSNVVASGMMIESGDIRSIEQFRLTSCVDAQELAVQLESLGGIGALAAGFLEADCDVDGDGTLDAYQLSISSSPIAVQVD